MKHYENLSADLTSFFEAVNAEKAKNIAEANVIADEARALIARAQLNREKNEELTAILGALYSTVDTEYNALNSVMENVEEALKDLYENDLPDCAVETFIGYCPDCGEPMTTDTVKYTPSGEALCPECYGLYMEMEEEEEEN